MHLRAKKFLSHPPNPEKTMLDASVVKPRNMCGANVFPCESPQCAGKENIATVCNFECHVLIIDAYDWLWI